MADVFLTSSLSVKSTPTSTMPPPANVRVQISADTLSVGTNLTATIPLAEYDRRYIDADLPLETPSTAEMPLPRNARVALEASGLSVQSDVSGGMWSQLPAPQASKSSYDFAEIQVWDMRGENFLCVVRNRTGVRWQDELNSPGSGSFTVPYTDDRSVTDHLQPLNIVKIILYGKPVFAFRIDTVQLDIAASGDVAGQGWRVAGTGLLGLLDDAIVYPEYGFDRVYGDQRYFSFAAKEGLWYIPSEWNPPVGLKQSTAGSVVPAWTASPEGWLDGEAMWIWHQNQDEEIPAGGFWARSTFDLEESTKVIIHMTADNAAFLYIDGRPVLTTDQTGIFNYKKLYTYSTELDSGEHLLAVSARNLDAKNTYTEPAVPEWITPGYNHDSNMVYVGRGFRDGSQPYVYSGGGIRDWNGVMHYGSHAFDGNNDSFWISVGNSPGWTSAFEFVEGSFSTKKIRAVKVSVAGGPYDVYVSTRNWVNNQGAWRGSWVIPYVARSTDSGARITYVAKGRVERDGTIILNVPEADINRVRITLNATWNSGIGYYKYRAAVREVQVSENYGTSVTSNQNRAGVLVSVFKATEQGEPSSTVLHRTNVSDWLGRGEPAPCWKPQQIMLQLMGEARDRAVLGMTTLRIGGFTSTSDSDNEPWEDKCIEMQVRIGDSMLNIAQMIVEKTDIDFWVDPRSLLLNAYNRRGKDRTNGPESVTLYPGNDLDTLTAKSQRPQYSMLVGQTDYGWVEVADPKVEIEGRRIESAVSLGREVSFEEALSTAAELVRQNSGGFTDVVATVANNVGVRAYVDYDVGDYVEAVTGFKGERNRYRVVSLTISEESDGTMTVRPELSLDEQELALPRPAEAEDGQDFTGLQVVFDSLVPSSIKSDGSEVAYLTAHVDEPPAEKSFVHWYYETDEGETILHAQTELDANGYTRLRTDVAGTWTCQFAGSIENADAGPISADSFVLSHRTHVVKTVTLSAVEWAARYADPGGGLIRLDTGSQTTYLQQGDNGDTGGNQRSVLAIAASDLDQLPPGAASLDITGATLTYTVSQTRDGSTVYMVLGTHNDRSASAPASFDLLQGASVDEFSRLITQPGTYMTDIPDSVVRKLLTGDAAGIVLGPAPRDDASESVIIDLNGLSISATASYWE